jgi:hypothetical protein
MMTMTPTTRPQPSATLETLLAFHAPRRAQNVSRRVNYRPPTDELRARLKVQQALASRGQHSRQSLPR